MPSYLQVREQRPVFVEDFTAPLRQSAGAVWDTIGLGEAFMLEVDKNYAQNFDPYKLNEDEIKERIGDLPLTAEAGISSSHLDLLIKDKKEEMRRQRIMSRAQEGIGPGLTHFTVGLASSLTDPGDLLVSMIPVVGQAKYARMLEKATTTAARVGVRAKVGVAGGVVGTAIAEPFMYGFAQSRQADYDLQDSFMNIVYGGLLGGGLHVAGGAFRDKFFRAPDDSPTAKVLENVDPETRQEALHTAVNQYASGRSIDVGPVLNADPLYSYSLGKSIAPPEGVGGRKKTDIEVTDGVLLQKIDAVEAEIDAKYEGKILPRGEIKSLRAEVKNLTRDIEKSNAQIEKRSPQDVVRQGHEKRRAKAQKRVKEAQEILKKQDELTAARNKEVSDLEAAKRVMREEGVTDLRDWPAFLKETLREQRDIVHKQKSREKLQEAVQLANKQKTYESYNIYPKADELQAVQKQVDEVRNRPDDDLLDETIGEVETQIDAIKDEAGVASEVEAIKREVAELEEEANVMEDVMKNWAKCRATNG